MEQPVAKNYSPTSIYSLTGSVPDFQEFKPLVRGFIESLRGRFDTALASDTWLEGLQGDDWMIALANTLEVTEDSFLTFLIKEYKLTPLRLKDERKAVSIGNEVLEHYAHFDLEFERLGWIPIHKVGPGLVFAHFLPNAPLPKSLSSFFISKVLVSFPDYCQIYQEFLAYDQRAIRMEYNYQGSWRDFQGIEGQKDLKKVVAPLLRVTHPETHDYKVIKDAVVGEEVDTESQLAFETLKSRLTEDYGLWLQWRFYQQSEGVSDMLGMPSQFIGIIDPRGAAYTDMELSLSLTKYQIEWLRREKTVVAYRSANFLVCAGPYFHDLSKQNAVAELFPGLEVFPVVSTEKACEDIFHEREQERSAQAAIESIKSVEESLLTEVTQEELTVEGMALEENDVRRFVERVIINAIEASASDIHFEMVGSLFRIRYRIDGHLMQAFSPIKGELSHYIIRRIKASAEGMDLASSHIPQDGRNRVVYKGRAIDLRIATIPSESNLAGPQTESCVMRILDTFGAPSRLEDVLWEQNQREKLRNYINLPYGTIVVTGPTGAGKSTTLYAVLQELNLVQNKILTVEQPVERKLPGIVQVNVSDATNFSNSLRTFLRMDPDIILVGETRDEETASLVIKASQTGHLVVTTMHTNSAIQVLSRFEGLGVKPHDIAMGVNLMTAQRLLRKLCTRCRSRRKMESGELVKFKRAGVSSPLVENGYLYEHRGCPVCKGMGYKGRYAVMELVEVNEELRRALLSGQREHDLAAIAAKYGYKNMYHYAMTSIARGMSDMPELISQLVDVEF